MIDVQCKVRIYEDGNQKYEYLQVKSHWNNEKMVHLEFNGERITVLAKDLHAAIVNATNSARW